MRGSKKTISCYLFIFYLIVSCVCFDNFRADGFLCLSDSSAQSGQLASIDCGSVNEDICTVDMLDSSQPYLLNQHTAVRSAKSQRKCAVHLWVPPGVTALTHPANFLAYTAFFSDSTANAAEILRFIHNKDGKKRI